MKFVSLSLPVLSLLSVFLGVAASYSKFYLAHVLVAGAVSLLIIKRAKPDLVLTFFFLIMSASWFWGDNPSKNNYLFFYLFGFGIIYVTQSLEFHQLKIFLQYCAFLLGVDIIIGILESFLILRFPISELSSHLSMFGKVANPYIQNLEPDSISYLFSSPTGFHWGINNFASVILISFIFVFFFSEKKVALTFSLVTSFLLIMASSRIIFWVYVFLFVLLWILRKSGRYLCINLVGVGLILFSIYYFNNHVSRFKAYDCLRFPLIVFDYIENSEIRTKGQNSPFDKNKISGATTQSQIARAELAKASLNMAKTKPLWGHGLGANNYAADESKAWSPHNLFLELLVDAGLVGLFLYLGFFLKLAIISFRQGRNVFFFFLACTAAIWTSGLVVSSVVYFMPYYLSLGLVYLIIMKNFGKELFAIDLK